MRNIDDGQIRGLDEETGDVWPPEDEPMYEEEEEDIIPYRDKGGNKLPYAMLAGVVVLVVLMFAVFGRSGPGSVAGGDASRMGAGLQGLDDRISRLESAFNTWAMRQENLEKKIQRNIDMTSELTNRLEGLRTDLSSMPTASVVSAAKAPSRPAAPASTPPTSTVSRSPRYHVVTHGDTLYSIHRKYGITLERLRDINNLKEGQPIYTGQKIYINKP
ncbi:MAG: LysM peptidoglycan-binding domain-containing protein [Desulfatibacillaceae bacterium]